METPLRRALSLADASLWVQVAESSGLFAPWVGAGPCFLLSQRTRVEPWVLRAGEAGQPPRLCSARLPRTLSLGVRVKGRTSRLLASSPEHRGRGRWVLWRPPLRRQHEGRRHPPGAHGDDRLRPDLLQRPGVHGHVPGELRRGRPHHHLLRGPEPQGGRGLRQDRQGNPGAGVGAVPGWGRAAAQGTEAVRGAGPAQRHLPSLTSASVLPPLPCLFLPFLGLLLPSLSPAFKISEP